MNETNTTRCTIAIADDDPTLRLVLRTMLDHDPLFDVIGEAADGAEAVALVERGMRPDVMLLDLNMPYMVGCDVLQRLRAECPALVIVVYSGEDEREGRKKVGAFGDFEYVVKGDPAKLISQLRRIRGSMPGASATKTTA